MKILKNTTAIASSGYKIMYSVIFVSLAQWIEPLPSKQIM